MQFIVSKLTPPEQMRRNNLVPNAFVPDKESKLTVFTREADAVAYATQLAQQFPTIQFGVFKVDSIFETTTPNVLKKRYNDEGELVLEKEE